MDMYAEDMDVKPILCVIGIILGVGMMFSTGCQKEKEDNRYKYLNAKCTCLPEPPSYKIPVTFKDYEGKTVSLEYTVGWRNNWNRYESHPHQICEIKVFTPEQTIYHYSFHEPENCYDGAWSIYCWLQDNRFNYSKAIPIKFHHIDVTTPDPYGMIDHKYVEEYFYQRNKKCLRHRDWE